MHVGCDTKVLEMVVCLHNKGHYLELLLVSCNSSKLSIYKVSQK